MGLATAPILPAGVEATPAAVGVLTTLRTGVETAVGGDGTGAKAAAAAGEGIGGSAGIGDDTAASVGGVCDGTRILPLLAVPPAAKAAAKTEVAAGDGAATADEADDGTAGVAGADAGVAAPAEEAPMPGRVGVTGGATKAAAAAATAAGSGPEATGGVWPKTSPSPRLSIAMFARRSARVFELRGTCCQVQTRSPCFTTKVACI